MLYQHVFCAYHQVAYACNRCPSHECWHYAHLYTEIYASLPTIRADNILSISTTQLFFDCRQWLCHQPYFPSKEPAFCCLTLYAVSLLMKGRRHMLRPCLAWTSICHNHGYSWDKYSRNGYRLFTDLFTTGSSPMVVNPLQSDRLSTTWGSSPGR
jgi:hypothetical protein